MRRSAGILGRDHRHRQAASGRRRRRARGGPRRRRPHRGRRRARRGPLVGPGGHRHRLRLRLRFARARQRPRASERQRGVPRSGDASGLHAPRAVAGPRRRRALPARVREDRCSRPAVLDRAPSSACRHDDARRVGGGGGVAQERGLAGRSGLRLPGRHADVPLRHRQRVVLRPHLPLRGTGAPRAEVEPRVSAGRALHAAHRRGHGLHGGPRRPVLPGSRRGQPGPALRAHPRRRTRPRERRAAGRPGRHPRLVAPVEPGAVRRDGGRARRPAGRGPRRDRLGLVVLGLCTTSSRSSAAPRASTRRCGTTACRPATSGRWPPATAPTPSASRTGRDAWRRGSPPTSWSSAADPAIPYADLAASTPADVIAIFVDGGLVSGRADAFEPASLPAACGNRIGDHFLCVDYDGYPFDHDELLRANASAVPLFSTERQASCGIFE